MYARSTPTLLLCYTLTIYSYTASHRSEHLRQVDLVLDRLRKHKQYAKTSKYTFEVQEFDYLSFVLRAGKSAMNLKSTKVIEVWEFPTKEKKLKSFLGHEDYYGRLIRNCFGNAKPLAELTRNSAIQ